MAQQVTSQRKDRYMRHFVMFSAVLFLVIVVVSGIAFFASMWLIIQDSKDAELLQFLELERHKLESEVNYNIAIVIKMATCPAIQLHFLNPDDPQLAEIALKDIEGYGKMFTSVSIFWVKDKDKIFFLDGKEAYTVNPEDPELYWYNMTMYETEKYNTNIDYDPHLEVTNIWINAPVFGPDGKPIGILGIGKNLSDFIDSIYQSYSGNAKLYFFNTLGEVTGSRNLEQVATKEHIDKTFGDGFFTMAHNLNSGDVCTISSPLGKTVVGTVPALKWYVAAAIPDSIHDYMSYVTVVFLMMLAVMALIIIIFNVFIAIFLRSLRKTMDSLAATSRYKSEFLARMSHEIRTPMNAILGMAEIALLERDIDSILEGVGTIKKAGSNLMSIINDILDFSKIESGKMEIVPIDYLFTELIDNVTTVIKIKVVESRLEFKVDVDSQIPITLFGDEVRFRQVMLNILNNAVKFTSSGFVSLTVKGKVIDDDNVILTVVIADSGQGIREEDIKSLFNDFVQFDRVSNKGIEGSGLGLAISKNLVEAMGGDISVQSEYGKGSIITITLPQGISHKETFHDEGTVMVFVAPLARVLVVDDVLINRTVAKGLLAIYGMQIHTCENGAAAVEAVQAEEYDLVFMDHMMPGMDGIEATTTIRNLESERFKKLPIVALTANAIAGMEEMFLKNGFNDYLSKPIDLRRLNAVLKRWIPAEKRKTPPDDSKESVQPE